MKTQTDHGPARPTRAGVARRTGEDARAAADAGGLGANTAVGGPATLHPDDPRTHRATPTATGPHRHGPATLHPDDPRPHRATATDPTPHRHGPGARPQAGGGAPAVAPLRA
ncbi:hypothetical protein [Kitasatospora sp. NPDC004531]